jgi:hypothetical protein
MTRALLTMLLLAGCADDQYLVVTVDARPAVHDAAQLVVTLSNGGTSRMDTLPLGGHAFPVTFSVTAPGRTGDLAISVEAQTADGISVGLGSATTTIGSSDASVMLDTTDFVVNTDYAMDQYLAFDYEANGLQLAASPDGHWTVGFRDSCNAGECTVFGRRFDATGTPASTVAAAGTNAFAFSSTLTEQGAMPAVASSGSSTLAFWDYADTVGTGVGVACRALDPAGNLTSGQLSVATDAADTVAAAHLSNDNIAVTWQVYSPAPAIRSVIVRPDCTMLGNVVTVSTTTGTLTGPHRAHAASNSSTVLYSWIQDGDVHIRMGNNAQLTGVDTTLITHTATQEIEAARVVPMGIGFGVIVRWADAGSATPGPGKIELYQVNATGMQVGTAHLITDQSKGDFISGEQSFGAATSTGGTTMVVWHVCDDSGSSCDVFGRLMAADGSMLGDPFIVPTTTDGDQTAPSVVALPDAFAVAWNDGSHKPPDEQGTAVRARIFYPPN